ncbi:nucleic acid/nucleotide deaminase domain-containing protein [Streptomyces polyrhachis]|uniref:Nucleic acid/nucleotide deaminase domain-containing protein n=1 Tax=Streptomyces polyrhachis TaxID=1282885 RepID=A0ABW2GJ48_9ACTN
MDPASDYDWYVDTTAEQLRQDQCLMTEVLRMGGPSMAAIGKDGLNKTPELLHELANRDYWDDTPLAAAYATDKAAALTELDALDTLHDSWKAPLSGLETPGGYTVAGFHWPPGTSGDGGQTFHQQTGLLQWVADQYSKSDGDFYEDTTAPADAATVQAVKALGQPLYGSDPDPGLPTNEWNRQYDLHRAYEYLTDPGGLESVGADNARLFLSSGGFPRTAPAPGTAEYRIAVEDLKSRFAACAWRDPLDPEKALGSLTATAAAEWQQEITSQATQRNQILVSNKTATQALTAGSKAMGKLLGHSWVADHLTQWLDYWSSGGIGWLGTSPFTIQVPGATGKCLGVQGGATTSGTAVEVVTCDNTTAQQWSIFEGNSNGAILRNEKSYKCLDVATNGTKIQIWTCDSTTTQPWQFNPRATTTLKNVKLGKCLNFPTFTNGQDALAATCNTTTNQKVTPKVSAHNGTIPASTQFTKAQAGLTAARSGALAQLAEVNKQATSAVNAAAASNTAEQAAYAIADAKGAPRGRGLLVGQQKAQVTQGASAALAALAKAAATAEAATRAAVADSETIAQRALTQAAQSKAEFRRQAAYTAELQAKAAADAARLHRDAAKKDKETAEAKLVETLSAEADAKAAAAEAHAKRLKAEAEEATAKKEKETAEAKQAEAAQHRQNAEAEAVKANDAKNAAEASEATAVARKNDAEAARDRAKELRDDAWDAAQKADAERAKADAKEAYAEAHAADSNAQEARAAADAADAQATAAEAAASRARTEADAATQAAADADAAAIRAEAAAKRARAAADDAQAAKLKADAAVRTATSAAADAIDAAEHAVSEANFAVKAADEAEAQAKTAKSEADAAQVEADKAMVTAAKAAGFAHITAQAAVDAGNAAAQVAAPANDAIQLGSPYVTKDSAAGLVVLTGQASKTIAAQQQAVADAHAVNAAEEAAAAQAIATQAQGDAKAAYQHAANAAGYAAQARGYSKEALTYAAAAATAAAKAQQSLARTIGYQAQATADALAADQAAGRAEGHAEAARASADQAALDAAAARTAASQADQAAADARAAADRADVAATAAEEAAKQAQEYAESAQQAAEAAENAGNAKQIETGTVLDENGISIKGLFYVVKHIEQVGDTQVLSKTSGCDGWWNHLVYDGDCTINAKIGYKADLDLYLCTTDVIANTCPSDVTVYLGEHTTGTLYNEVEHTITIAEYQKDIDPVDILFGSWIRCFHKLTPATDGGSWGGCGWALVDVATLLAGKVLRPIADAVRAIDAAAKTGIGFTDAFKALRTLGLADDVVARIGSRAMDALVQFCTRSRATMLLTTSASVPGDECIGLILYNSDELSHMAYQFRTESGFYGASHNVAVARVPGWNDPKTGDLVVASSSFSGHSETAILDMLKAKGFDPRQITALYSERQPCGDCASELAAALKEGTPISWSVPYFAGIESGAKELLAEYIKKAGGAHLANSLSEARQEEEENLHG